MSISLFDVIGPVMIGPSSSHTAGAARLGNIARRIAGESIKHVDFYLHGSFAQTYKGHGTDKALLGGVMGMAAGDEGIRESFAKADQAGITYNFHAVDLGNRHPNTVKIVIGQEDASTCSLIGSSVGGGKVLVNEIDGMAVEFSGQYPTIICQHHDEPGVIARVSSTLSDRGINIAFLKVFRQVRDGQATMIIETDQKADQTTIAQLEELDGVDKIRFIDIN